LLFPIAACICYVLAIVVNASRILFAVKTTAIALYFGVDLWHEYAWLHEMEGAAIYLSALICFYLLIHISEKDSIEATKKQYIQQIETFLSGQNPKLDLKNAQISFTNTYTTTLPFGENWQTTLKKQAFKGGFYAERAIKQTLFAAYAKPKMAYPVLILLTDNIKNAVIEGDFADFAMTYPESNFIYALNIGGNLTAYSLTDNSNLGSYSSPLNKLKVLAFPNTTNTIAYLAIDDKSSIVLKSTDIKNIGLKNTTGNSDDSLFAEKSWSAGLAMQGEWLSQIIHPETAGNAWLALLKHSFQSKILTPVTAYMVVENEAQKAILAKKQAQVLSGNKYLDLDEDVQPMSEPSVWLLAFLLLLCFGVFKRFMK
jgi:hypothetical protein